ncbi:hypothetical protein ACIBHY_02280 [Nonomuraea sp. NPDC050547]|uniref:hypothetical protein n=1 Tax=Nonomuraea sp. NPDC050547 TaxID=3364368 RepID=UPI0037A521AE
MVAVLLAGADAGRERPSARETFDLLRAAFTIRLRRAVGAASRRHWNAAFRLAALLAPIWPLVLEAGRAAAYAGDAPPYPEAALQALVLALPYGVIAFLAWRDARKVAASVAWGWTVLVAGWSELGLSPIYVVRDGVLLVGGAGWRLVLPACLVAVMLTLAPSSGPARPEARRPIGWAAALLAGVVVSTRIPLPAAGFLPILVLAVVAVRSPVGRRAVLIVSPLMGVTLGWIDDPANLPAAAACSVAVLAVTTWAARTAATAELRS